MDILYEALGAEPSSIPISKLRVLKSRKNPETLKLLNALTADKDPVIRGKAKTAISYIEDIRLSNLLESESDSFRESAIIILGKTGDPQVINSLLEALEDSSVKVRQAASNALINMRSFHLKQYQEKTSAETPADGGNGG